MTKIIPILLLSFILLKSCSTQDPVISKWEEVFINPSVENRPLAFYDWLNGFVDTTRLVYELEEMKDKGMQGALIWDVGAMLNRDNLVPTGPAFLGEESLEYISLTLRTAERLGLNMGLISASSWNAGGDWIDPKDASKELLSSVQRVSGPGKNEIIVGKPRSRRGEPELFKLLHTVAIPVTEQHEGIYNPGEVVVLDSFTSDGQAIEWDVPAGLWEVISFFMCNTGQKLMVPSPNSSGLMIDHLSREATRIHFDTILSRLDRISTEEQQLKFLEVDSYEVWWADDWTPEFVQEFKDRYEYNPIPYLPLLKDYTSSDPDKDKRFLADYSRLVSDLMIENHFVQATELVEQHDMQLFAEAGHGGSARVDPLKALGSTHIPMGEFWNRQRHWVTKEAASAAHIYGRKIVASESLTGWNHWQHGPTDFKQLCDVVFCEGLNQVFFHTFAHNPAIAGKPGFAYHAGEHINTNATWWEMVRPYMDYLSRTSFMLRQGEFVGDVCLYYGDQAPNLVPPKRIDPNYSPDLPGVFPTWFYDETKCPHCGQPKPINPGKLPGYDYDYINADVITTTLSAENGKLVLPSGQSYRVMALPDREDISLEVIKRIESLVQNGAVIIGRKPTRATSLKNYPVCDAEVKEIADRVWGDCDGQTVFSNEYGDGIVYWGKSVLQVLEELNIPPDFEVQGVDNCDRHIDYIHRQTESADIYFVSNCDPESKELTCIFRVEQNRIPEIWDVETGLIQRKVQYTKVDNRISIDFVLPPLASFFVVFKETSTGVNDPELKEDLQFNFLIDKNKADDLEHLDISSDWTVSFNPKWGGPESIQVEKLASWTESEDEGVKYYSGKATYTKDIVVSDEQITSNTEAFIVFEDIQEMARVFVNGHDCGIVWTPPYKARITPHLKTGKNQLRIEVINNWNNRIVGDLRNPDESAYTSTNAVIRFNKDQALLESGLIGKAEIVIK